MTSKLDKPTTGNVSQKIVLIVVSLPAFLMTFMISAINIALPIIGKEFSMDSVSLAWIVTSYLLASAVILLPGGKIADIYGRKRIFTFGVFIFTASALLAAVSVNGIMLIIARTLQGIGGAIIFTPGLAIISSVFPSHERGKAFGINVTAVFVGYSTGPYLGGLLTSHFGWRSIFYACLLVGVLIIILLFSKIKTEWTEAGGEKFDLIGAIIYGVTVILLIYGITLLPSLSAMGPIVCGLIGIFLFVRWETKVDIPILRVTLFRHNRAFAFSNLAVLIISNATFAVTFLLSLYLQYIKGFNPQTAGLALIALPAIQAIMSPIAGRLSDNISPQKIASAGMMLTSVGLFMLTLISQDTAIGYIVGTLIITGFGYAFFISPNMNALMSSVEKKDFGVASATMSVMRQIGWVLSMATAMVIFAIYIGQLEITPDYYSAFIDGIKVAFTIFAILCSFGVLVSIGRGKIR